MGLMGPRLTARVRPRGTPPEDYTDQYELPNDDLDAEAQLLLYEWSKANGGQQGILELIPIEE